MHEVEKAVVVEEAKRQLSRKRFLFSAAGVLGGGAVMAALPGAARAHTTDPNVTDEDILNYALTLEHLEYAFYRDGLDKFGRKDFEREFKKPAGRPPRGRGRPQGPPPGRPDSFDGRQVYEYFELIREHEDTHVDTLTAVITGLPGTPVPELEYNFERTAFTSVGKFVEVAQFLENTGVSAYDGAIAHIEAAGLLTAGATIATVEARHASYLNLLNGDVPFPAAFDDAVAPQAICRAIFAENGGFVENPDDSPYGPYQSLRDFCDDLPTTTG